MAGDWIKMRSDVADRLEVARIAQRLTLSDAEVVLRLVRLAGWFGRYGDYGTMRWQPRLIDQFLGTDGFAQALEEVRWLRQHDGCMTLHGFTSVSANRKSLGAKVRQAVLSAGRCAACGSTSDLVIDHKTPVVRGGSCDIENLQALCAPCNRRKGRKTMQEFMA